MNALEALEELECVLFGFPDTKRCADIFDNHLISPIKKELKALEIVKEKKVNLDILIQCNNVELYNKCIHYFDRQLAQEEYELLKEVLE